MAEDACVKWDRHRGAHIPRPVQVLLQFQLGEPPRGPVRCCQRAARAYLMPLRIAHSINIERSAATTKEWVETRACNHYSRAARFYLDCKARIYCLNSPATRQHTKTRPNRSAAAAPVEGSGRERTSSRAAGDLVAWSAQRRDTAPQAVARSCRSGPGRSHGAGARGYLPAAHGGAGRQARDKIAARGRAHLHIQRGRRQTAVHGDRDHALRAVQVRAAARARAGAGRPAPRMRALRRSCAAAALAAAPCAQLFKRCMRPRATVA